MKKLILFAVFIIAATMSACAYDFSAVCSTGQTLYYKIGFGVTVTSQNDNYPYYSTQPTGNLVIPSSVEYNGISYTVTGIDQYAFLGCTELTSVNIPSTVTTIGRGAFYSCRGLWGTLTLPNSVTSIGDEAFYECSGLRGSLTIPNSVTSIGDEAFYKCSGLTGSLTIPNSVTSIGDEAFYECTGLSGTLTLPNSITAIGDKVFCGCSGLTGSLTIPNSVTSIGEHAFEECIGLTSITIPNSVITIGKDAFAHCSGLTGSLTIPNSVTFIGGGAFSFCIGLTSVNFNATNCTTGGLVFASCSSLATLSIGDNVQVIPDYIFGYSGLTGNLTIPNSVVAIGNRSFYDCIGLTSITIPNSVITIGEYAFAHCSGLTGSLTIPNSVTSIGKGVFRECSGLTGSLTIPNSVTSIGDEAFYECTGLSGTLTLPNSITAIGDKVFYGCGGLDTLTIPNSVMSIGNYAFEDCVGLSGSLTIPNTVTSIGEGSFYGCIGFTGSLTIPNSVINIGASAFSGCVGLTRVSIGKSVSSIGNKAFGGCTGLASVNFNATNCSYMGTSVNYSVFNGCSTSAILYIGDSVQSIPRLIFAGFSGLNSVSIARSVTFIGRSAFKDCIELTEVHYNATNCTTMGSSDYPVFEGCSSLANIYIGDSTQSIPNYAFKDCSQLRNVVIPNSVTSIGEAAFSGCSGMESLVLGNSVSSVGDGAFSGCSVLLEINSKNPVPPTLATTTVFSGVATTIPVYIPCGRRALYLYNWPYFSNFVENIGMSLEVSSVDNNMGLASVTTAPTCDNSIATITAYPNSGYRFDHWSDNSTANPYTLTVTEDTMLIAYFVPDGSQPVTYYTLTVIANDPSMGTVSGGGSYAANSTAIITATANSGYHFVQWQDGNTQASRSVTVTSDATYTAYFEANAANEYTITVIPQNPAMGSTTGSGTFEYGTVTTITAEPYNGYHFVQWQDGNTQRIRTITVTGNATYTAYFDGSNSIDDVETSDNLKIYSRGNTIVIDFSGQQAAVSKQDIVVYDVMGRVIKQSANSGQQAAVEIPVSGTGVYMVKVGDMKPQKVVVRR
ncbi:MAG: leucine-rich repeat domain-containing protein [Bacteroidales bacterium]|nr:leucine-rich repeat domain-containing protein [Bacteroidales bacterium]